MATTAVAEVRPHTEAQGAEWFCLFNPPDGVLLPDTDEVPEECSQCAYDDECHERAHAARCLRQDCPDTLEDCLYYFREAMPQGETYRPCRHDPITAPRHDWHVAREAGPVYEARRPCRRDARGLLAILQTYPGILPPTCQRQDCPEVATECRHYRPAPPVQAPLLGMGHYVPADGCSYDD